MISQLRPLRSERHWCRIQTFATAASSVCSVDSWNYSDALLDLCEIPDGRRLLPPILPSTEPASAATPEVGALTGLPAGTPVVTGLHDRVASHLGTAGQQTGHAVIIAGTFGVNLTLVDHPVWSPMVTCRPGARPEQWTLRWTSLASGANVVWAVDQLADHVGAGPDRVGIAIERALAGRPPDQPTYLPYLFGGAWNTPPGASFHGIRPGHTQLDLLRAVLYGVTLDHRLALDQLRTLTDITSVHLTGGAARSPQWSQLLADGLGLTVELSSTRASAALGAAVCAVVGSGHAIDLRTAYAAMRGRRSIIDPRDGARERIDQLYVEFRGHLDRQLTTAARLDDTRPAARDRTTA